MLGNAEGGSQLQAANSIATDRPERAAAAAPAPVWPESNGGAPNERPVDYKDEAVQQSRTCKLIETDNKGKSNRLHQQRGAVEQTTKNSDDKTSVINCVQFQPLSSDSLRFHPPTTLQRRNQQLSDELSASENERKTFLDQNNKPTTTIRSYRGGFGGGGGPIRLAKQESLLSAEEPQDKQEDQEQTDEQGSGGRCWSLSPLTCCTCCCSCLCVEDKGEQEEKKSEKEKEKEKEKKKKSMWRRKRRFWLCPLLLVLVYSLAIYCLPFLEVDPRILKPPPNIPFNFNEGPLRPSTASQFVVEHLFRDQINGAESMAFDKLGNAYLAIEGGFILYAHLNKSSPFKSQFWPPALRLKNEPPPNLVKIAELNGVKQLLSTNNQQQQQQQQSSTVGGGAHWGAARNQVRNERNEQSHFHYQETSSIWRRECQLDEQLYGAQLYEPTGSQLMEAAQRSAASTFDELATLDNGGQSIPRENLSFVSHVKVSRCSKPLGMRLSPDESALYVIDTLTGLYKVHLRVPERPHSTQRLVSRLIDFRANNGRLELPVIQLDGGAHQATTNLAAQQTRTMNVSLRAVDDLDIDHKSGSKMGDLIYLSLASQQWPAVGFLYDFLEGRPSGQIVRFDTGTNQLVVMDPDQLARVRSSGNGLLLGEPVELHQLWRRQTGVGGATDWPNEGPTFGVPRLDENDVFDDRPLHFPNGLQLMDDRQALLIADTSNKRIIKHYIGGPRRGTSDLWAYTPGFPDNIRRGYDKRDETYWVVGCGKGNQHHQHQQKLSTHTTNNNHQHSFNSRAPKYKQDTDMLDMLRAWPTVRKFAIKNIYFFGWFIEKLGQHLLMSPNVRDYGYELKVGSSLCQDGCVGMMIMQYNRNGDLIRSIHSPEFPNDLKYYSQVNEIIDAQNQQHLLYLSSPRYKYVTKLILPTQSYLSGPILK